MFISWGELLADALFVFVAGMVAAAVGLAVIAAVYIRTCSGERRHGKLRRG